MMACLDMDDGVDIMRTFNNRYIQCRSNVTDSRRLREMIITLDGTGKEGSQRSTL